MKNWWFTEKYRYQYRLYWYRCPPGYDSYSSLDPSLRCNDQFIIESGNLGSENNLELRIIKTDQKFSGFCLNVNNDLTYSARVCRKSSSRLSKFKFYPYILIISNIFLLATFVIYVMYRKTLLRHYTKLMLHLCGTLFAAFLVLAINQFYHFANHYITLCRMFGKSTLVWNIV